AAEAGPRPRTRSSGPGPAPPRRRDRSRRRSYRWRRHGRRTRARTTSGSDPRNRPSCSQACDRTFENLAARRLAGRFLGGGRSLLPIDDLESLLLVLVGFRDRLAGLLVFLEVRQDLRLLTIDQVDVSESLGVL